MVTSTIVIKLAGIFSPTARALIGYFEAKLFPAESLGASNIAKAITSERNSALLHANVDRRPPFFAVQLCYPPRETLRFEGNKINCFPRDQSLSVECLP